MVQSHVSTLCCRIDRQSAQFTDAQLSPCISDRVGVTGGVPN